MNDRAELEELMSLLDGEDYDACRARLLPMLRRRSVGAIAFLGCMYWLELGFPRDVRRAERYLTRAARAGDALAAHNLSGLWMTTFSDRPGYREEARRWAALARANGFDMG